MVSSTLGYRWHVQRFSEALNRLSPFNPLDCFAIHFKTTLILFLCISGFRSISSSCLSCIGEEDSSLADGLVKRSERGHTYIKRFGVGCSAILSTNHCYQSLSRILIILCAQDHLVDFWEGDLSLSKLYEGPLFYAEESPLTLCNHFMQPYGALDTHFFEYY